MRNVLRVFARDSRRFLRVPIALVILGGLVILPCLYAWFNIVAFWDPYGDTKAIRVDVVNLDKGATSEQTGKLNVGDQIIAQLKDNHEIGWQFVNYDAAMKNVRAGSSYAAIVIPTHFSSDLLTIMTDDFVQPKLDYYENQKANAIAPKITGAAASAVTTQVNNTFVSTVAETAAKQLQKAGASTGKKLTDSQSRAMVTLKQANSDIGQARTGLRDTNKAIGDGQLALRDARTSLNAANATIGQVQTGIGQTQSLVNDVQKELTAFTTSATNAYVTSAATLSSISSQVNGSVSKVTSTGQQINGQVGAAINAVQALVNANTATITGLQNYLDQLDPKAPAFQDVKTQLTDTITNLQARQKAAQQLLSTLNGVSTTTGNSISQIQKSSDAFNSAIQQSANSAGPVRDALTKNLSQINQAMSAMSASAGAFSTSLTAQRQVINQSVGLLNDLNTQLTSTVAALISLDGNLATAQKSLQAMSTDLSALDSALIWNRVNSLTALQPQRIAKFMVSPVTVNEKVLFSVPTYGSAMAPLFTNLALWIGAFVLVVLIRQEVDTEGIPGLTVRQAYFGRWLLMAVLNLLQGLLVSIGNIVIGVQMVNPALFVLTSVYVGFIYLLIIYALSVCFGYVGRGIIVILVIMQIPGASGIYPIQMMPAFFQKLFPFFPFAHGIDAMREVVGGFYDHYYLRALAILAIFGLCAILVGVVLRQRLGSFARLFNQNLDATELYVAEDVQILGSRRKVTQIARAITDKEKFRAESTRNAAWFHEHHRLILQIIMIVAGLLTLLLLAMSWVFPDRKALVLGLWAILCLLVIALLVALEYIQQSLAYEAQISGMASPQLQDALRREIAATHSNAALDDIAERQQQILSAQTAEAPTGQPPEQPSEHPTQHSAEQNNGGGQAK